MNLVKNGQDEIRKNEKLIAKYSELLDVKEGGIFTVKTRKRLLGISGPGRDRADERTREYDFWYDVRNKVKTALADFEFFLEVADDENVNKVITLETLEPIAKELFWGIVHTPPKRERAQLYSERAKIADLFIKWGFEYLRTMNPSMMTLPHKTTVEQAIDLSRFLLETFKAGSE